MSQDPKRAIVAADRLSDGIIIEFDDGRCGVFDVETLYALLPRVRELSERPLGEERQEDAES